MLTRFNNLVVSWAHNIYVYEYKLCGISIVGRFRGLIRVVKAHITHTGIHETTLGQQCFSSYRVAREIVALAFKEEKKIIKGNRQKKKQ
ncbi:hypothetical protein PV327_006960 [Microctonus hyperodae]|uniref:Uncharacterized protein n=1 Tax=Microctonus hyperodae TaxID=165561 RepID=A0AA39F5D0_MICHY|nr:hypothetical protein PV327_006960 [Microctonus hyperodae]